jgi:hypothetical protein
MYLTAHRVRDAKGKVAIHAFLHAHDRPECRFPRVDPWSVPDAAPGRLVRKQTLLRRLGGNSVLSYLDLIVDADKLEPWWVLGLRGLAIAVGDSSPYRARVGPVYVMFAATPQYHSPAEYSELLDAAVQFYYQDDPHSRQLLHIGP